MHNILMLVKTYYTGVLGWNKIIHSKDPVEKRNSIAMAALLGLSFLMIFNLVYGYSATIADFYGVLVGQWVVIAMMMAMASSMNFMNTVFRGNSILFHAQDEDMLLSMPIPFFDLIVSKLLNLYLYNLFLTSFVMIPASVAYAIRSPVQPSFYLLSILGLLAVPILPMVVGCIINMVVEGIAGGFRGKNVMAILLNLVFMVAIMTVSFSAQSMNQERITQLVDLAMRQINQMYPLAGMYARAVSEGLWGDFIAFFAMSMAAFAAFSAVVAKNHALLREWLTPKSAKVQFKGKQLSQVAAWKTLFLKDLKFYFSSPVYVLNTGIGAIGMPLIALMLILQKDQILPSLTMVPGGLERLYALIPVGLACLAGLTNTTSVALSIEGPMYAALKSWPVDPMTLFFGKILVNISVLYPPAIVALLLTMTIIPLPWFYVFMALILPVLTTLLVAQIGILINLKFPKFDWVSHTVLVKQSMAAFLSIVVGFGLIFLMSQPVLNLPVQYMTMALLLTAGGLALLNAGAAAVLKTWGRRAFFQIGP